MLWKYTQAPPVAAVQIFHMYTPTSLVSGIWTYKFYVLPFQPLAFWAVQLLASGPAGPVAHSVFSRSTFRPYSTLVYAAG